MASPVERLPLASARDLCWYTGARLELFDPTRECRLLTPSVHACGGGVPTSGGTSRLNFFARKIRVWLQAVLQCQVWGGCDGGGGKHDRDRLPHHLACRHWRERRSVLLAVQTSATGAASACQALHTLFGPRSARWSHTCVGTVGSVCITPRLCSRDSDNDADAQVSSGSPRHGCGGVRSEQSASAHGYDLHHNTFRHWVLSNCCSSRRVDILARILPRRPHRVR